MLTQRIKMLTLIVSGRPLSFVGFSVGQLRDKYGVEGKYYPVMLQARFVGDEDKLDQLELEFKNKPEFSVHYEDTEGLA